ncbi:MAG TPA: helix-turn-helix domain-containing protein [Mucilaginibacter sp.]|jgi:transcriptional regulator GlxA family with amidase domain
MRIAILNFEHAVPACVTGPAEIWRALDHMQPLTDESLNYNIGIDYIREHKKRLWRKALDTTKDEHLAPEQVYDLVIIPAMRSAKIDDVVKRERMLVDWLKQQHRKNADLASICIGAFLLAETGLLKGKTVTTNLRFADLFRQRYPEVQVQDDKIIVDQGNICTCGGAFIFTTFMIYLIEKFFGHEEATMVSKILMINTHQQPQHTFSVFQLQRNHADEKIMEAQIFIEKNYQHTVSIEKLAGKHYMSSRNFIRRFERATSNTPLEYLQRVRMEAAKKFLENSNDSIEQIAIKCGYDDIGFFRKIFKRHVAINPKEYQKKYGKTA